MTVDTVTNDYISDLGSYAIYADARIGDNGAEWGLGEMSAGTSTGGVTGFEEWDDNPWDGINTGLISVELRIRTAGGEGAVTWQIGNQTLVFDAPATGDIDVLELRAGVQSGGISFEWSGVGITFYNDGQQTEFVALEYNDTPVADTMTEGWTQEQITTIDPTTNTNDEVVITGAIQIQMAEGYWASGMDIFGAVLIRTV